jgi:hypothetical protein
MSLGSFHAATQRMHDAVIAEFSDSHTDVPTTETEPSLEAAVPTDPDMPAATAEDGITLVEILSQTQGSDTTVEGVAA